MRRVSVGVVGLGTIAQTQHLPNLALLGDLFGVCAVADLSPQLTDAIADRLPEQVFTTTDWREVCAHPQVEAVLLLTPGAHQQMSEGALLAGKHVFAEKPLSLTVAGAKYLSGLADRTGLVLQVGYMKLHEQCFGELMSAWQTVGEHRLVRHTVYHPSHRSQYGHLDLLRFDDADPQVLAADEAYALERVAEAIGQLPSQWADLYRKFLVGSVIHTASVFRATMGMLPQITFAEMWPPLRPRPGEQPSSLFIRGRLPNHCRVEMTWLWLPSTPEYRETLEVHGTRGSLEMSLPQPYLRDGMARLTIRREETVEHHPGVAETAFVRELRAFHSAITNGHRPPDAWRSAADLAWLQTVLAKLAERSGVTAEGEAANYSRPGRFPKLHAAEGVTS